MKTITIWREGNNYGSVFKDGDKTIHWESLTNAEKEDFVNALRQYADFYERFI